MNIIEEQTKKFLSFKQKLPSKDIDLLISRSTRPYSSLLTYFYEKKTNTKHKNPFDNKPNTNPNLTEKIGEPKQKEKNIFISQKLNEKNKGKTTQGKSHGINTEQTPNNRGNGNKESESPDGINLLQIENDDMKREKIIEIFAKREEEKKMNVEEKNNQANEAAEEEVKEEKEEKDCLNNKDEFSFDDDDNIKNNDEKDGEERLNPNHFNNSTSLNLKNYESGIPVPNNGFSIFDNTKIDEEQYGENLFKDQNDSFEEKNRDTFDKKNEMNEEKNNKEERKEKMKEKAKEKKSHEKEKEKETKRSSSKICIPLDEEEKKEEKEKNNKNSFLKPNQVTKNIKNNSDKKKNINNTINNNENLLQKKHTRISQSERITSSNNKNENNSNNKKDNFISSHKPKSKIILDEGEDEEISINTKNPKKNIVQKKQEEKPLMTNEGNKFIINFEANETKNNNENIKENQNKEISINIETEPDNKINKNNLNKNKNGSQNNSQKNNNLFNDYDISCVENITGILTQIKNRLNGEGKEKISLKNCFDLIKSIKSDDNYKKRIKDTYMNVFKLLRMLFKIFSENEISLSYNNEIIAIFILVDNYYKKVKINDNDIDSSPIFHKRKIALKYAFSKLELRNYEKQNYKELYIINNKDKDKEENDIQIKDNTKAIKFIKISKRYCRTSGIIYKEIKDFRDKLKNMPKTKSINNFLNKYENVLSDIQSSPHFMKYNKLFAHFSLVFSFHFESKNLMKEIEGEKKKDNNNINDERKKGKSMQLNKNGIFHKRESSINNVKMKNNK